MDSIVNKSFYKRGAKRAWLKQNGFKYNIQFSDRETDVFTHRFPIHKYKDTPVLECEIMATVPVGKHYVKRIWLEVYQADTRKHYHSFYYNDNGNYTEFFEKLTNAIQKELDRLGIKRKK